jgi:diacylglycerol kinase family enzyme
MRALGDLRTTRRPTLRVRDTEARAQQRIGFIFGAGLVARFFEVYEREGANGERGAAKIVARIFAGAFVGGRTAKHVLTPQPCHIEVDGERVPFDRASLVAASVIEDLGLHMRLLHRAAERSDRFHFVATPAPPRTLAPQMFRVLSGVPLRDPKIDTLAKTVTLRFPEGTGAYVLDGELLRSDRVEIEAGPVLRFVDA